MRPEHYLEAATTRRASGSDGRLSSILLPERDHRCPPWRITHKRHCLASRFELRFGYLSILTVLPRVYVKQDLAIDMHQLEAFC